MGALEEKLRAKHPTIAAAFNEFDEDRSGVSKDEFRDTLYKLNIGMTKAQVDRVFAVFDANQDGVLDYTEFCEELASTEAKNNMVYRDVMDGAQGNNPYRASAAENLLPKWSRSSC